MSRSICLRCLSRSLHDIQQPLIRQARTAPFSTSAQLENILKKKSSGAQVVKPKGGKQLVLKKKTRTATGKPPAPGERKALRKRIVLSNPNALEVQGLRRLDKNNGTPEKLAQLQGAVLAFSDGSIDALRSLQAFKTTQNFSLFRVPSTIITNETVMLARAVQEAETNQETARLILTGEHGSGKSVLQLQAMSIAMLRGWIVIHIPEGQELTNAQTSFEPLVGYPGKTIYVQPHYTAKLLEYTLAANQKVLAEMQLSKKHRLPIPVPNNISLSRLLELGARDPSIAWPIWEAFLEELSVKTAEGEGLRRPPVMLSMDSIGHVMKLSQYVDPEMRSIHAHELALVASFMRHFNGTSKLANGGVVLGSTSASNCPATPTFSHILDSRVKAAAKQTEPVWDPYAERDPLIDAALQGVQVHKVGGLNKSETKSLMEYFALSGIFRDSVTDAVVAAKWSASGGGIAGEVEKSCVKQKF